MREYRLIILNDAGDVNIAKDFGTCQECIDYLSGLNPKNEIKAKQVEKPKEEKVEKPKEEPKKEPKVIEKELVLGNVKPKAKPKAKKGSKKTK